MSKQPGAKRAPRRSLQLTTQAVAKAPSSGLFTTPGGAQVYYEDSGGSGTVLFYLYGLACSIKHWKYQLAHFGALEVEGDSAEPAPGGKRARASKGVAGHTGVKGAGGPRYRQVWLDFRGHGRSPPVPEGCRLTMAGIVEDVVGLCSHLDIKHAVFLGQSMGGALVLQIARDHPQLAQSLVLLASPVRDPGRSLPVQPLSGWIWRGVVELQERLPFAVKYGNHLRRLLHDHPVLALPLRELIRRKGFNPNLAQTADVDEYVDKMLSVDSRLFSAMAAELSRFDAVRFAHRIGCPVLIIAGQHDLVVPLSESRRLLRHLPNGQLAVVPHGSHCPHFDDAATVNRILGEFLATPGGLQLAAHER